MLFFLNFSTAGALFGATQSTWCRRKKYSTRTVVTDSQQLQNTESTVHTVQLLTTDNCDGRCKIVEMRSSLLLLLLQLSICRCNSFHLPHPPSRLINNPLSKKNGRVLIESKEVEKLHKQCTLKAVPLNIPVSSDTITATSTIIISSIAGFASDRLNITRDSGLVITLILAATLSNFGLLGYAVPISHPIYDLCWSKFLPGSLALILFSSSSSGSGIKENDEDNDVVSMDMNGRPRSLSTKELIVAVGIPFLIGSFGSLLGCIFSSSIQVWAGSINSLKKMSMGPVEASVAAGKLSAIQM